MTPYLFSENGVRVFLKCFVVYFIEGNGVFATKSFPLGHFCSSSKAKLLQMKRKLKSVKKNIKEKGGDVSRIF